jgi:nucleotide-binding universal stress UspA family protein
VILEEMPKAIVVPIDGSEFSTHAVPAAATIARATGAIVKLVTVANDDDELVSTYDHVHHASRLLPEGTSVEEDVIVGLDPAGALLEMATDAGTVLCVASHDHLPAAAAIRGSVGTHLIQRATHPLLVVGAGAHGTALGSDVVVALDGECDAAPLLSIAATWAVALDAPLRIATVYEPVLADVRRPDHFSRSHGPPTDPGTYLEGVKRRLDGVRLREIELVPIPDPVSVPAGLGEHLRERPALMLVASGRGGRMHVSPGVVRDLLRTVVLPVLVVPSNAGSGYSLVRA